MIIYFSGTGNSLSIAKKISQITNDKVVPIKNAINDRTDKIIFVFPTYAFDMPIEVEKFIKQFEIYNNQSVMGISVSASNNGNSENTFNRLINAKGLRVSAFLNVIMTDNYTPVTANKKVKYKEINLDKTVNELLNMNYVNKTRRNPIYTLIHKLFFTSFGRSIVKKKINYDKCIGCKICSGICPNNNISIKDGKVSIGTNCSECFGCIHWCPNQVIYIKKGLTKQNQYHNKDITYNELNK